MSFVRIENVEQIEIILGGPTKLYVIKLLYLHQSTYKGVNFGSNALAYKSFIPCSVRKLPVGAAGFAFVTGAAKCRTCSIIRGLSERTLLIEKFIRSG